MLSVALSRDREAEMTMAPASLVLDAQPATLGHFGFAMSLAAELQPDQNPELWNNHVTVYEEVFEPLTNAFATLSLNALSAVFRAQAGTNIPEAGVTGPRYRGDDSGEIIAAS